MWTRYQYQVEDIKHLAPIRYYLDHLESAREAGYDCVSDWVRDLHAKHHANAADVAKEIGITFHAVLKWFRKLNLPVQGRGGRAPMYHPRRAEVVSRYEQMGSALKVAKDFGVSPSMVYKWLRQDVGGIKK